MIVAAQLNPLLMWFLVMFAALIIIILFIAGFILLMRRVVKEQNELNNHQKAVWKDTLEQIGLKLDPNNQGLPQYFDVAGEYQNCKVKIAFSAIQDGETSDIYTACEAFLPASLNILLEITSEGRIKQALNSVFEENKIKFGLPDFESRFKVTCLNDEKARHILTSDLSDGETRNLAADLLSIKEFAEYIKITDESVYLKNKGQLLELKEIKPLLDSAVYLTKRIQKTTNKLAEDLDKHSRLFPQ